MPIDTQFPKAAPGHAVVYLFAARTDNDRDLAPRQMWGTLEAIAGLAGCKPLMDSAREVPCADLVHGFVFGGPLPVELKRPD